MANECAMYVTTIVPLKVKKKEGKILLCTVLPQFPKGYSFLKFAGFSLCPSCKSRKCMKQNYGALVVRHLLSYLLHGAECFLRS